MLGAIETSIILSVSFANMMKYILIALWLLLLTCVANNMAKEISDLKERDSLHSQEIIALRGYIAMVDDKADRIEQAREEAFKPFIKVIPVDGGFLGIREEER